MSEPVTVTQLGSGIAGERPVSLAGNPLLACAFAERFAAWLATSARPIARGSFGRDIVAIRVGGGYECRRRNRQATTPVSEHGGGRALDMLTFEIDGGEGKPARRIAVAGPHDEAAARFLRAIRDSACGAFMTTLGPGSDAAHADHIHVDIQERRSPASRFCQ